MADLTPRTRSESFLNGEDLEPITRREHFYAGRENELPEGHQEPKTREEWFIQKYREAGDVTVESLSITENGTYTAPSGKAYSPVSVNVPLPSNAYLLKSIENVDIATFTDGTDNFLKSLEVAIEPVQSGSGEPSPTNIRPISGWNECKVTVADDLENPTVSNVYIIDLDGTRYGGKVDLVNGGGKDRLGYVDLGTLNWDLQGNPNTFQAIVSDMLTPSNNIMCSHYPTIPASTSGANMPDKSIKTYGTSSAKYIIVKDSRYSDVASFKTAMNGVQLLYELATQTTYDTQPTAIKSLQGDNNFFASTGEIELLQYWGR